MNAGALIDDRALPGWMNQPASASANTTGGLREGLEARSLIDETALPQWLRGQQAAQSGQWNASPAAQAMAQEPLHSWLAQPQAQPAPLGPTAGAAPARGPAMPAAQLADESALPEWLRIQGSVGGASNSGGRPGMAANNLVDPAAMPAWVRSGSASADARFSASAVAQGAGSPVAPRRPPDSSWLTDAHVPAPPPPPRMPGDPRGLATEELPSWLRNAPRSPQPSEAAGAPPLIQPMAPPDPFRDAGNLRDEELPPWVKQKQGAGQPAARPQQGPHPAAQPGFGSSASARIPRAGGGPQEQGYGGDEWDEPYPTGDGYEGDYTDEDAYRDWDDGRGQRERRGFFSRFRRP